VGLVALRVVDLREVLSELVVGLWEQLARLLVAPAAVDRWSY